LRPTNSAKRANKGIFRLVTNANCPKTNLYVHISNDRAQACAEDLSHSRKPSTAAAWRAKRIIPAWLEVARYLSQAEFPCCNRCVTACAVGGGLDGRVLVAASAPVKRGTLTFRCRLLLKNAQHRLLSAMAFRAGGASCDTQFGRPYRLLDVTSWRVQQREGQYPPRQSR
jgi:hypothetical protein